MTDQLALGLLAQIVQQHKEMIDLLTERVENLEAMIAEGEPAYLDGSQ
jgi:Mg2+ and Co2+ transporter CorA